MIFELTLGYSVEVEAETPYAAWQMGERLADWLSRKTLAPDMDGGYAGAAGVDGMIWTDDNGHSRGVTQRPRDPSLPPKEQLPMAVGDGADPLPQSPP